MPLTLKPEAENGPDRAKLEPPSAFDCPIVLANFQDFCAGLCLFNQGNFFAAHESLEALWLLTDKHEKQFLQGLIQLAVAWHHWQQGNLKGAAGVLGRARQNLEAIAGLYPEQLPVVNLRQLLTQLEQAHQKLNTGSASDNIAQAESCFNKTKLQF